MHRGPICAFDAEHWATLSFDPQLGARRSGPPGFPEAPELPIFSPWFAGDAKSVVQPSSGVLPASGPEMLRISPLQRIVKLRFSK